MKTITITVEFSVVERPNPQPWRMRYGTADELLRELGEYLTSDEGVLRADYGEDADGGYDGAYITDARIIATEIEDAA